MPLSATPSLTVPSARHHDASRSPSPANRVHSRSPHPYRRKQQPTPPRALSTGTPYSLTPASSRRPSPRRGKSSGVSESGTEADDELARRLPAPPMPRRTSSEDDEIYHGNDEGDDRGRRPLRKDLPPESQWKRYGLRFMRRLIELALAVLLAGMVLTSREGRVWREVSARRKEFGCWGAVYATTMLAYPLRILACGGKLQLPKSLDPAPILYPLLLPILVALSLTPVSSEALNPYLLINLILSLSSLPPTFFPSWNLQWLLSLSPLLPSTFADGNHSFNETLTLVTPINMTLTSALTNLLHPSFTTSELRLLSSALINLLFNASSPPTVILKAIMWGGGIGVFLLCEDLIKWNINLARIPFHRFRRAGNAVIGVSRFRRLVLLRQRRRQLGQASDSEADETVTLLPATADSTSRKRKRGFYASLTHTQARMRHRIYGGIVYGIILCIVLLGLRPYIAVYALDGVDPFVWAFSYLFCGTSWYQSLLDELSPGTGYCVTAASTEAANLRLMIIGYWAMVLVAGIPLSAIQRDVDTRRKVFHGMVIFMFLIPGLLDPPFTYLCLTLALAVFLLLDMIRAGQLPPASSFIARFLQPYVDGRDLRGPVVVSHVFLLTGCGVGWWLTVAGAPLNGWDWGDRPRELAFVSGVVGVGMGDTAASLIGRRFGRTKWGWRGSKSVEGSAAFMAAVVLGLGVGRWWTGATDWSWAAWTRLVAAAAFGSMLEATVTGVNDNVIVPVGVWLTVRGLGL